MLELQKILSENKPEELTNRYAIKVNRHKYYNNLFLFKYSQIDSPMGEKIVQESRGIILDDANNWTIVSFPYMKFFNYGEGHAANIDWNTAKVYEKLDGSLIVMYRYDNKWNISSSGNADAGGEVYGFNFTFAELFWKVWGELNYKLPEDTNKCYMFELMTPYNKIVVQHKVNRIVLHGARDMKTLKEEFPEKIADIQGWECVKIYPLATLEDIIKFTQTLNPVQTEGFVVIDNNFNRVKIKSPQYVALSNIKESMSPRKMIEIVRTNEYEEFLQYFPEYMDIYKEIEKKYNQLVNELEQNYEKLKDIELQKDFALKALKTKCSACLFSLRKSQVKTVKEYLAKMQIKDLEAIMGLELRVLS